VTPFENHYPNLGTHASVINMLLQRDFVYDTSPWWSWLIGVVGALALTYFLKGKKPVISLSAGGGVSVAAVGVFALVFITTGLYVPVVPMASVVILSFFGTTIFQFLNTEKEKGFLRSAFGRYLSNDVIQQIIANPDQLRLGGQQKVMTAMFTDIRGFSTISEKMTPEELVFLLNQYLTGMSDIILDLQGTIDKYEGDAIIAFFGAPIDLEDHARRAALAAVRMKRMEDALNLRFLEEKIAPSPLLTRIGINTGPMVVGNMGTNRKMDYTMIGDAVNLAARLEGVNKLYGTWILISEDTKNLVDDVIITRKLDRVRVVGKSVPIRLYQAIEEKGHLPEGWQPLLDAYQIALEHFEERRWPEARKAFDACLKLFPEDGPSLRYRKLAADYEKTPPPEIWDGVFKLESK
jgi:adenylate cyclase